MNFYDNILNKLRKMTPDEYEASLYKEIERLGFDVNKAKIEMSDGEIITIDEFLKRNRKDWSK